MDSQVQFASQYTFSHLSRNLWTDAQNGESGLLDFSFRFPDGTILRAHRNVLAASSEFFKNKFSIGMVDSTSHESFIELFTPGHFKSFLEFVYTGQISTFDPNSFSKLFELGQFYDIPLLETWLIDFGLDPQSLPSAASVAIQFSCDGLLKKCKVVALNFLPVINKESLHDISEEVAGILLCAGKSGGLLAVECFKFYSKWCKANDTQSTLLALMVDQAGMSKSDVENLVVPSGLIPHHMLSDFRDKAIPSRDFSKLKFTPKFSFKHDFKRAFGITISPCKQNRVVVTDDTAHLLLVFDCQGNHILTCVDVLFSGHSFDPAGAAISLEGLIYVSDFKNNRVRVFSSEGKPIREMAHEDLECPNGLSIDHTQRQIHVCSQNKGMVCVFSETDGKFLFSYGSGPGKNPCGVAIDCQQGKVFVVDKKNIGVSVFSTLGDFVTSFGHAQPEEPKGRFSVGMGKNVAFDPCGGHLFVVDNNLKTVQVFTRDGEWVCGIGKPFDETEFGNMYGIAVGHDGLVYLCQERDGVCRVEAF